jgi:TonB family protein
VRWDSPLVLATSGTLAIHVIIAVCADAIVVTHPVHPDEPAPHVELVDLVPVPPPPPPPPPPLPRTPEPQVAPEAPRPTAAPPPHAPRIRAAPTPVPPSEPPPEAARPEPSPPGGAPVMALPDVVPGATGIPVARGPLREGHVGRGGTGTGTGAGSGAGAGDAPTPVSIATIKTRALPRGDFGYYDAGKDYPAEAKQLGIEGAIRVRLVVDAAGHVKASTLLNRLGHGLDELALRRAAAIQFEPARDTDDHPVTSVVIWTFTMTLPK